MEEKKSRLGYSNKFFYYSSSYGMSFSLTAGLRIKNFSLDAMNKAVDKALDCFPEFTYRPVVKDNAIYAMENNESYIIEPKSDKNKTFGTDETNGYLFYFSYEGNRFEITYFHGLSDAIGMFAFIQCLMYYYAMECGKSFSDEEVAELTKVTRLERPEILKEESDALDPYGTFGKDDAKPEFIYDNPGAFSMPSDFGADTPKIHMHKFSINTHKFLSKTKEFNTSFAPLLCAIFAEAASRSFDTKGRPVTAMLPVNFRPYFDSHTYVNFSDGILIPYEKEYLNISYEESCKNMKDFMKKQLTKNNFAHVAHSKVEAVKSYENGDTSICDIAKKMTALPPKDAIRPVSYAITYVGNLTICNSLRPLIDDYDFMLKVRSNSVCVSCFEDRLDFSIARRSDDTLWIDGLSLVLKKLNLDFEYSDLGIQESDYLFIEKLFKIN